MCNLFNGDLGLGQVGVYISILDLPVDYLSHVADLIRATNTPSWPWLVPETGSPAPSFATIRSSHSTVVIILQTAA